jgi:hypothetical protein
VETKRRRIKEDKDAGRLWWRDSDKQIKEVTEIGKKHRETRKSQRKIQVDTETRTHI